jgi:hypothetical protein
MRETNPPDDVDVDAGWVSPVAACVTEGAEPGSVVVVVVTLPGGSSGVADGVTGPTDPGSPA